ncbi:hypothetical protein [Bradyrhizobium glycinis]|uniref:hypothetical protein n=1 Tax=Bradyrhizobium glycinis TaxID=2751812 RepID=UPI0018D80BCE|nr:hypothetical protein [Bradyrhizobium glycinis]MBH5369394.1 hypothetical protein [Bradyrhizobium glycinis]
MVGKLEQAIAPISRLPVADQENLGRKLLSYVERLSTIRCEIGRGIRSLDAGKGESLNMEEFLRDKNSRH